MTEDKQLRAPIAEAMKAYASDGARAFHTPGHKQGLGAHKLLQELITPQGLREEVSLMEELDDLHEPTMCIKDAQDLAAELYGADAAYFMINGTSGAIHAMLMGALQPGDKVLVPRNAHRSLIGGLILTGATPVFIQPRIDEELGIPMGLRYADIAAAVDANPEARALLLVYPTYYGVAMDLQAAADLVHSRNMLLLVDEAHGTHLYFGDNLPISGMAAGADLAAVSMHKSGGSLTQSSIMLCGQGVDVEYVQQIINLTQTTSASYLLISSLDLSRRNLALHGRESFEKVSSMAEYARAEINEIGGFYAYGRELIDGDSVFDFDVTKLSVFTQGIGMTGIEVYDMLRDEYDIQIEFGDIGNILAYISIGDRIRDIERLVGALEDIADRAGKDKKELYCGEFIAPELVMSPREAFYAQGEKLPLEKTVGRVAGEMLMCYPPGIPILTPGERITQEILDYIEYAREKGCSLQGTQDLECREMRILTEI